MNATILHDVEIGSFCIIGEECLVIQGMKIPDNSIVVGFPAKIKGQPLSSNYGGYKRDLKHTLSSPGITKSKAYSPIVIKL
jgi:carbonic anhydrase/acetyltransferase-like protein (isoleucine patch superfamily)